MSIVIATPTGHIGSRLVRRLLDAGERLVLLARDPRKLDAAVRERVTVRQGALQDAAFVREATAGADALFWLTPSHEASPDVWGWYRQMGASAAGAVEGGVRHVVTLSSQGAHHREGLGPVSGLRMVEDAVTAAAERAGAAVRHLRPGFFFENFAAQLGPIREAGAVFFPAPTDWPIAMIATEDIAERAAALLRDRTWSGTGVVPLHGPRDYTYAEAAAALSDALGRPVRAQQVPREAVVEQLKGFGATDAWAQELATLYARIGDPAFFGDAEPRTAASTTPTRLADWAARTLRPALEGSVAA